MVSAWARASISFWAMRMRQREMDWKDSRGALFLVMPEKEAGRVIGTVSLSNISRGVFQGCHLGYNIDHAHQGQGLLHPVFEELGTGDLARIVALAQLTPQLGQCRWESPVLEGSTIAQRTGLAGEDGQVVPWIEDRLVPAEDPFVFSHDSAVAADHDARCVSTHLHSLMGRLCHHRVPIAIEAHEARRTGDVFALEEPVEGNR